MLTSNLGIVIVIVAGNYKIISSGAQIPTPSGIETLILFLAAIAATYSNIIVKIKRLHDINLSGWWLPVFFLFGIPYLVLYFWSGTKDKNRFDEDYKEQESMQHNPSLARADTEAIKDYVDKHAHSSVQWSSENDNVFYEQAMTEIEEDTKVRGIWAKALANSDGNIDRAKSLYIQMRVQSLKIESKNNIALKSDSEKIQEFSTNKLESSECDMLVQREKEKNFFMKFYNGEFLLWKTFLVTILILIIIAFLQSMLYEAFSEKSVMIAIDTLFFIIILILLISSWNSTTLQSYISFTFWPAVVRAIIAIFFFLLFTIIIKSISGY